MLERLERNAVRQRRFVDDAAHELRSPIASLRVQLETARDRAEGGPKEAALLHETARMERLVDQMLLLARADADTPWFRASAVDLDDVVDSAVDSSSGESEVTIDTSEVEAVQVMGDADLLEQMVRNLVQNGLRFAREVVRVSVGVTEDRTAVVTVEDDGPGIPADRREEIFDPFVRLDGSRDREHGGVGLGLAIVSEIVRAHLGTIEVMDSSLGGARFVVELPMEESMSEDRGSMPR
jgi:signal transduction histidine kinase